MKKIFMSYKSFFYSLFYLAVALTLLNGCSGSSEVDPNAGRIQDSIEVYTRLDKAFLLYEKALSYNESFQDNESRSAFDNALKMLSDVDNKVLDAPGNLSWKNDYNELAVSIVQDYLSTQSNIPENSQVFKFAKKLSIDYEKINEVTQVDDGIEPLPDGKDLPLIKNSVVEEYIDFFSKTERGKNFIDKTMYRSGKLFPIMRKILKHYGAPEELIYLSVQESGLNPTIVSRAGAVGLWQFMPATGYSYGLYQDEHRDDRRDFEKSTDAAARHLIDLYNTFDDWYLAFAAYNAGPGRVNSAIRKSGSRDFWEMRNYLPGETKNYVPSILALSFIYRNPEVYGFTDLEMGKPISYDRVNIKASLTFDQIVEMTGSDIETIRELNPELTNDVTPVYDQAYQIRIPHNTYKTFAENYKKASFEKNGMSSPEFAGNEKFNFGQVAATKFKVKGYFPLDTRKIASFNATAKQTYVVLESDKLSSIAIKHRVRPTDIRIWNKLGYGKYPKKGQQLIIITSSGDKGSLDNTNIENVNLTQNTETNSEVSSNDNGSFFKDLVNSKNNTGNKNSTTTKKDNTSNKKTETKKETTKKDTKKEEPLKTEKKKEDFVKTDTKTNTKKDADVKEISTSTPKETKKTDTKKETVKETKKNTGKSQSYTVEEGDYLSVIAGKYGVSIDDIMEWNNLESDMIMVGQKLTIYSDKKVANNEETDKSSKSNEKSKKQKTYTVEKGDNLAMIADKFNISINDLVEWNEIEDGDVILIGQTLIVSEGKTTTKKKTTTTKPKKTRKRK
ncbi:MAG TPA: LysM peptidoglycan-binding domain-containing protein [Ignavibacteria bacterium]|nr:LysM peptidoglycan-binding domain-containing protein [Ignavibacteria bacterium]